MTLTLLWPALLLSAHLAGWGGWVSLPALALVVLAWGTSLDRAVSAAWATGLFLDACSVGRLGIQALAWALAAATLSVEQRASHRRELPTLMLACGLAAFWLDLLPGLLGPPWGGYGSEGLLRAGLSAGCTALVSPLILAPVRARWRPRRVGA